MNSAKFWLTVAAINGFLCVAIGGYGWHALSESEEYLRDSFNVGVQYHMWHALAMIAVAWLCDRQVGILPVLSGIVFMIGIIMFSGTLYYFGFEAELLVNGAAPLGGATLMAGWLLLAASALKLK